MSDHDSMIYVQSIYSMLYKTRQTFTRGAYNVSPSFCPRLPSSRYTSLHFHCIRSEEGNRKEHTLDAMVFKISHHNSKI